MYNIKAKSGTYESKPSKHRTSSFSSTAVPPRPPSQPHATRVHLQTVPSATDYDDDDDVADDTSYHNFTMNSAHVPDLITPDSNAIHYQITHDDPHFKRLSLHPLHSQFEEFAKLRSPNSSSNKKAQMGGDEFDEDDLTKIALFGIEAWFNQGKIFATPLCKITLYDVRSMFWRVQKSALTFKEFETFIEDLAEFRQIHPDTIVFRLRLSGSPELEARLSHLTIPEGTVDRVVDAFRLDSENVYEEFVNLSKTPYTEPVCFGGVPHARKNKGLKSEQEMLKSKAIGLMTKADPGEKLDHLMQNFIYFAKNGTYMSDGRTMELTQLIKWIKQAGIIDGNTITSLDIGFLFKRLYALTWRIYFADLHHFLRELAGWKRVSTKFLVQKLRNCFPPASSSVTIISLTLPETLLGVLKAALHNYAEEYEENRDLYEPTSADGPFGHTPNSRNRHFKNYVEASVVKVHTVPMGDGGGRKKKSSGDSQSQNNDSVLITTKRDTEVNDKEEAFSEETTRSGKNQLIKRWNDAYPFGQEGIHRARVEAELEKLMFGPDRADDSSSDEDVRKTMFRRYDIAPHSAPISHPAVPLEEQFEKFRKYGEYGSEDGITLKNIELWFNLAGMLVHGMSSLFTVHELETKFRQFKFAQEHNWLDYDKFLTLLEALAGGAKKKTNIKEMKERLSRCGPPREPMYRTKTSLEDRKVSNRSKDSKASKDSKDEQDNATAITKSFKEEEEEYHVNGNFKARYQEFARFGEPTVPEAYSIPGLSMLNANKWFRESKLLDLLNRADVDVLYKQLYPTRQRISLQEFCKLTQALLETIPERDDITFEFMLTALADCGQPQITEIPITLGVTASRTNDHVSKQPRKSNTP